MTHLRSLLALAISIAVIIPRALAAGETSIWINQIPLYSSLAPCALDRVSAIIRDQASGCNDDSAHTSFACFCIESSSAFSSVISTAVAQQCSRQDAVATSSEPVRRGAVIRQAEPTAAGVLGDVSTALEVWESYCAKSTMLNLFSATSTPAPAQATVTITQPPHTITVAALPTSTPASAPRPVPIAAIIAPAVVIALVSIMGAMLYVRRARRRVSEQDGYVDKLGEKDGACIPELVAEEPKSELSGRREHSVYRVELPGGERYEGVSR